MSIEEHETAVTFLGYLIIVFAIAIWMLVDWGNSHRKAGDEYFRLWCKATNKKNKYKRKLKRCKKAI